MKAGSIIGSGIDLVENERMQESLQKWKGRFKSRVFLKREQKYCDEKAMPVIHYAGRFAVKEAVSKAFGTGVGPHIGWLDIEVIRHPETGAPSVRLSARASRLAKQRHVGSILISLAHTRHYAVAHALLVAGTPSRKAKKRSPSR